MFFHVPSVLSGTLANLKSNLGVQISRNCRPSPKTRRVKSWSGMVKKGGLTYYPRPGEEDPPYEPTKLFMVHRIKQMRGIPYWQKQILQNLKIDGKMNSIAIVKNEPYMNSKLWIVKHLIKITPITLPEELPDENNLSAGYLKENGEFVVNKKLAPDSKRIEETNNYIFSPLKLDGETLRKKLRLNWLNSCK